ncbi:flavin reductase family protein [Paenactinomyces guangxiensis]
MKQEAARFPDQIIRPKILYYGTPVVLLNTLNEDETTNISPISSSWALGDSIVLGLSVEGKGFENIKRHGECVINIPHPPLWEKVEKLACYTGKYPVPEFKKEMGFKFEKDKFRASGLTPLLSDAVQPSRIMECPIQIEANVQNIRVPEHSPYFAIVETKVIHVHAHSEIVIGDHYIDPGVWSPLIYNFRHYFGLGKELGKTFRAET